MFWNTAHKELISTEDSLRQLQTTLEKKNSSFGSLPLLLITSQEMEDFTLQQKFLKMSKNSKHVHMPKSNHYVPLFFASDLYDHIAAFVFEISQVKKKTKLT